jgi:hypothetical protein
MLKGAANHKMHVFSTYPNENEAKKPSSKSKKVSIFIKQWVKDQKQILILPIVQFVNQIFL